MKKLVQTKSNSDDHWVGNSAIVWKNDKRIHSLNMKKTNPSIVFYIFVNEPFSDLSIVFSFKNQPMVTCWFRLVVSDSRATPEQSLSFSVILL